MSDIHSVVVRPDPAFDAVRPYCSCGWQGVATTLLYDAQRSGREHGGGEPQVSEEPFDSSPAVSDVDALTAFIRARLDDEEGDARSAEKAQGHAWRFIALRAAVRGEDGGDLGTFKADVGAHIARQDPAATLARVAALRALVDLHEPTTCTSYWHETNGGFVDNGLICDICANHDREDGVTGEWPCATMRHLAAIWRDHPDFPTE